MIMIVEYRLRASADDHDREMLAIAGSTQTSSPNAGGPGLAIQSKCAFIRFHRDPR
jgi:hypothetical protein